jgi:putative MATE family efflux protein
MKDLTQGSIVRHVLSMAAPITFGMVFQTLYYIVDLYFVAQLGDAAIAGVSAAGNVMFLVFGFTQVLGVGAVALISHAVGRKDQPEANLIFNQSIVLSAVMALITLVLGYALTPAYMRAVAADAAVVEEGVSYLFWFMPGLALQFGMVAMGSALRGTGIVRPTMVVQVLSVILNTILAPVLIAGWGTGKPMGAAGAGLASTISIAAAVALLGLYFFKLEKYVAFHHEQWRPRLASWKRIFAIGLPAGGEMLLMFVYLGMIYFCISRLGAVAQAGFGIGSRVMQSIFLPAMAVAFAAGPIAGQNFGAKRPDRVRETFYKSALISTVIMVVLTVLIHWRPDLLVAPFTSDPAVREVASVFLKIATYNFVAQGLVFTCSSMFQGLGDTRPAMLSTGTRLVVFAVPAIWVSGRPEFRIEHIWYLSVITMTVQAIVSLLLLRAQFQKKVPLTMAAATPAAG